MDWIVFMSSWPIYYWFWILKKKKNWNMLNILKAESVHRKQTNLWLIVMQHRNKKRTIQAMESSSSLQRKLNVPYYGQKILDRSNKRCQIFLKRLWTFIDVTAYEEGNGKEKEAESNKEDGQCHSHGLTIFLFHTYALC